MKTALIKSQQGDYNVHIGKGILSKIKDYIKNPSSKCLIVSEENVAPLYLNKVKESLCDGGITADSLVFVPGEKIKSEEFLFKIYDKCLELNFNRGDTLIALGGGVIGDLVGFAAGTFMRGINFINIPTTLLSMVDSSVGGKVAINHPKGKNLIGMFYQPKVVIADIDCLSTLDDRQFACGMAEIIKYACINDKELFEMLKTKPNPEELVYRCVMIKEDYVQQDTFDKGVRMLLNFGHTIGHVIENHFGYGNYLHGEAVAIGMVMESAMFERLGIAKDGTSKKIEEMVKLYNLPYKVEEIKSLLTIMKHDKKSESKGINFAAVSDIGQSEIKFMSYEELEEMKLW